MAKRLSEAEKTAVKIARLVNDLTLDLDQVGVYLAREHAVTYRRIQEIAEAAKFEKEEVNNGQDYLW